MNKDIPINEWVKLTNLFSGEMGDKVRAKKHLTIGYTLDLLRDFTQRAYLEGKKFQAQAEREGVRQEERAKWLPLLEAVNKFDSYFDFDTPLDDSNGFEDTSGINEARVKLVEAIQLIRAAEAGQEGKGE